MKQLLLLLIVCSLFVLASCGGGADKSNATENISDIDDLVNVTVETGDDAGAAGINAADVEGTVENVTDVEDGVEAVAEGGGDNETEDVGTTDVSSPVSEDGCPLINTSAVMEACKRDYEPNVTINGTTCVFGFGPNEVRVRSVAAEEEDFDAWLDSIYTSEETGVFKPRSGMAEERGTKYFAWFTGKKLVTVESSHVLACTGSNIQYVAERVDLDAKLSNEKSTRELMMENVKEDAGAMTVSNAKLIDMLAKSFQIEGVLAGVEGYNATGTAKAMFRDDVYFLQAEFEDVPDPAEGFFYEGWIVRKGVFFSAISVGKAESTGTRYQNMYMSSTDLSDHNFYVLTLEPDDGNPAPADHVLEGRMS